MIQHAPVNTQEKCEQIPLFTISYENDELLKSIEDNDWYWFLNDFAWTSYRDYAVEYYQALYRFNLEWKEERVERGRGCERESREDAQQRLLFERATMDATKPKLFEIEPTIATEDMCDITIDKDLVAPGVVPLRIGGKKPKCFFALLKAFLGTIVMGRPGVPEEVYHNLINNPTFARNCGFTIQKSTGEYRHSDIPKLRKIEQFDQIMTQAGLWNKIKKDEVRTNIETGVILQENILVHDTTHYHGYSSFETIEYVDEHGKVKKKSQSKVTKLCGCGDKESCSHDWILADDGCGTVVKSNGKMYWAHKAAVIGLASQGVPLDAVALNDASTNDGDTPLEHIDKLFSDYPMLRKWIDYVLADAAYDSNKNRMAIYDKYGIILRASLNPRRKKSISSDNLPRGMKTLTAFGNLTCQNESEMNYTGVRLREGKFIYTAPQDSNGQAICNCCVYREACTPQSTKGRTVLIDFDLLPGIDPEDPPMAKRFKAMMRFRPSVERMISFLKKQLGDDRLSERSNASFQALLDKTMIVFHQLLRQ